MTQKLLIHCTPARIFNEGYIFEVNTRVDHSFLGSLSKVNRDNITPLGTEAIDIQPTISGDQCSLRITQKTDGDNNKMVVTFANAQPGPDIKAKILMNINDRPIPGIYRDLTCFIQQSIFNQLCNPSFGGAIY